MQSSLENFYYFKKNYSVKNLTDKILRKHSFMAEKSH